MSKLDEQIRRSLRGSRRDSFRDLLAGKIFRANRVRDPLERIKQLCLAALLAKRRYEDLEIDVGLVKRLYDVAICLEDVHASSQRVCEVKMIPHIDRSTLFSLVFSLGHRSNSRN